MATAEATHPATSPSGGAPAIDLKEATHRQGALQTTTASADASTTHAPKEAGHSDVTNQPQQAVDADRKPAAVDTDLNPVEEDIGPTNDAEPPAKVLSKTPKSASCSKIGDYNDLKKKTASFSTAEPVHKSTTYMTKFSNFNTAPAWPMGSRGPSSFIRGSSTPAPGSYTSTDQEKHKFKATPKFSFGGGSRFGLGQSPTKKQPGPGAYNPRDPIIEAQTKVGFGSSIRGKGSLIGQANPGPGAYEARTCLGTGHMYTARGRMTTSYLRARSQPGPGAYNPSTLTVHSQAPKCGFGTSSRDDVGAKARSLVAPGPGAYELQNFRSVGGDAPKYSATSRRRLHDLSSYVTPGPGSYNAHVTSFGYCEYPAKTD